MWTPLERYQALRHLRRRGWVSLLGAAKILGVSYPTAQKMKRDGKILTVYVGTHRVTKDEILRVCEQRGIPRATLIGQLSSMKKDDDSPDFLIPNEQED